MFQSLDWWAVVNFVNVSTNTTRTRLTLSLHRRPHTTRLDRLDHVLDPD